MTVDAYILIKFGDLIFKFNIHCFKFKFSFHFDSLLVLYLVEKKYSSFSLQLIKM